MDKKAMPIVGIFNADEHLTPAALNALHNGSLCDDALKLALEHISGCEACADALASLFDDTELMPVPAGFAEELQNKLDTKNKSRHAFAFYVMRVAIAACVALIITFSSTFNYIVQSRGTASQIKAPSFGFVNAISEQLSVFSQNIVKMEAFNYVQAKK